ncbi:MAG TPA: TIR domain-containing protein [Pyrinomonadaceae bacterium]|nr:TIR domain-containing protein [Pyrinomonadaceae bacterium]
MALNFLKSLDADDIFISYSREDGSAYLTGLDAALSKRGFSCFTDKRGTDAGKLPPETLYRKVRACKTFVLLATPGALKEPENIAPEVTEFANANGTSRIICVSFDQDEEFGNWASTPWYMHVEGKAREREHPSTLKTGEPSEKIIEQVVAASDYMKSKDRLRRYRNSALSVLGVLIIAIIGAAIIAGLMFRKADAEARRAAAQTDKANQATQAAAQATSDAEKALSQALNAQMEAGVAQLGAEIAKADATEQKKLADAAAAQARQERARATQQQTIAKVRSLANSSQTLLRQRPQEIQRSMSRAVEAMKLSDSLKMHILEADTALRDNLTLLPTRRNSRKQPVDTILAFSPDGRHLARRDSENKVGIYEVGKETLLKEFVCTSSTIALSSGLKYAAATTEQGIKIFDLNDDTRSHLLNNEEAGAADKIAISPTGRYLAFTVIEGEDVATESFLKVVETSSGKLIKSVDDLQTKINDIAFSATGNLAAGGKYLVPWVGAVTGHVILWDLATDQGVDSDLSSGDLFPRYESILVEDVINSIALSNNSFATNEGIWKKTPGASKVKRVGLMPYPPNDDTTSSVRRLAFGDNGKTLIVARYIQALGHSAAPDEDALEVWDAEGHEELVRVFSTKDVLSLAFKPGNRVIALTGEPSTTEPATVIGALDGTASESIDWGPKSEDRIANYSGNSFIVSINEHAAEVWDVFGKKKQTVNFGSTLKKVEAASVTQRGDFLVLAGEAAGGWQFVVYHSDGNSFREWKKIKNPYRPPEMMSLSADGKRLAVIHQDDIHYVRVWDVSTGREITPRSLRLTGDVPTETFSDIKDIKLIGLSPSGQFLVVADFADRTWILDFSRGEKAELELLFDNTATAAVSFSPEDRYLGIGSDNVLHVYDLKSAEGVTEIASLQHPGNVTAVAFSEDSKYVATASSDKHPYRIGEEEGYPICIWLLQPQDLLKEATARLDSISRRDKSP